MSFLTKEVVITDEAIKKLFRIPAVLALAEAIWNAIDAKAKNINIKFEKNQLDAIQTITIIDDGEGIPHEKSEECFLQYQKSWKTEAKGNYHGKNGEGRFKLLAIAKNIEWNTSYQEDGSNKAYTIKISKNKPKSFEFSAVIDTKGRNSGTEVKLTLLDNKAQDLNNDSTFYDLIAIFALHLKKNNHLNISLNGQKLSPQDFIFSETSGVLELPIEDTKFNINYIFIGWNEQFKFNDNKHTFFFDEADAYIAQKPSGIQGNYVKHSVFLKSNYFKTFDGLNEEWQDKIGKIRNLYKKSLLEFLMSIRKQQSATFYNEFASKNFYPFSQSESNQSIEEKAIKDIYDLCAFKLIEEDPKLFSSKNHSIKLLFKLLKKIVEKEQDIGRIISEVLELDNETASKFVGILDATPLPSIVTHLDEVVRKLTFLDILEELVHDDKYKKKLKERSQLHKIIEKETWIFGSEYEKKVGTSDKGLAAVITENMKINALSETEIDDLISEFNTTKKDDHLKRLIPDLYLWHDFKLNGNTQIKNLIVELKAPKVKIGRDEYRQIEDQRMALQQNTRYKVSNTNKWEFYVVSSEIESSILEHELSGDNKDIIYDKDPNFIVYCRTWDDLIRKAKLSLNKQKEELQIQIKEVQHKQLLDKYLEDVSFNNE